jgi:hypothetical protein
VLDHLIGPSRVISIPSSDAAFREHVDRLRATGEVDSAPALQARLRRLFPRVIVRERQLSAEAPSWYVYRDGRWVSPTDGPWWESEAIPRVRVSLDGWIVDGTPTALSILGLGASSEPRHFTDFVVPGTLEDATAMFSIVASGLPFTGTTILKPVEAEPIAVDVHAIPNADGIDLRVRLAEDVDVEIEAVRTPRPDLSTFPAGDTAFAAYAHRALALMPEPTPGGLGLRLRRLYPHARVDVEGAGWVAHRDVAEAIANATEWWNDVDLPRVRYDAEALILEANDPARALLGSTLVGHHWQEFVTPGSTEQVAAMLAILAETGGAESRFRIPSADGSLVEFDSWTEVDGETFTTTMRPRR